MSGEKISSKVVILGVATVIVIFIALWFRSPKQREFFSQITRISPQSATILIVGDMMLDRNVRNTINGGGFDKYFSGVKKLIGSADIAVANLEGPFTDFPSITSNLKNKELKFTFDPALAPALSDLGFDAFGLANNHALNFGYSGLESTKNYIKQAEMVYYGDPENKNEISTIITKNGIKIGFVGFHEFSYMNFDKVLAEIARLRNEVDVLIVTPHWGVEYQKEPTTKMTEWAHSFIDFGANVVIGAHPHVIGHIEEYKNKKIYYSLGNFAFDQYFSEETMKGLGIVIYVEKYGNKVDLRYRDTQIQIGRKGLTIPIDLISS